MFRNRDTYRTAHRKQGLTSFDITVKETNLNIQATTDLSPQAIQAALDCRAQIEAWIAQHPEFGTSLAPLPQPDIAPPISQQMTRAGQAAQVGPMAAVAGTVAEFTGRALMAESDQVVVENGGDIFIHSRTETTFAIYAGEDSPFSMRAGIKIPTQEAPFGLCTSSGTLGHSKSFGRADAVTVMARDCALADAAATALANAIRKPADINPTMERGKAIPGIQGLVMIMGDQIGLWGDLTLVPLN
ncbi:MAG: UPF0280 family protein [Desulfobacterales bacterium]|nr:UPF0280 family protein [Desulfobacterales bacterium]